MTTPLLMWWDNRVLSSSSDLRCMFRCTPTCLSVHVDLVVGEQPCALRASWWAMKTTVFAIERLLHEKSIPIL